MRLLKRLILSALVFLPFFGKFFTQSLLREKRLHERFALKKLANVMFLVTLDPLKNHTFFLRDISLGGLSFFLEDNDHANLFTSGKPILASLTFEGKTVNAKFRVAYTRSGITGCQVLTNKIEYKKFVIEKMSDILVKDISVTG